MRNQVRTVPRPMPEIVSMSDVVSAREIECTASAVAGAVSWRGCAAFGIGRGRVVLVAETTATGPDEVAELIRAEVRAEHAVELHDVVLVRRGAVALTADDAERRTVSREWYLGGLFCA
ncbi:fatty acyl-AMP ligase [Solihabitans fulvus]|uniref:Fatty acyl-AMP ligase n=1 Tax=Solihabitans fulvus TaxID=1892852 RepID=A0A5B2XIA3_9PSEU|nr:fatty acyl-AMP ligase [Solihabitans fulvus]KAA2262661.1 fatty acyl-AMP ligase [Solihabitans fulvus]